MLDVDCSLRISNLLSVLLPVLMYGSLLLLCSFHDICWYLKNAQRVFVVIYLSYNTCDWHTGSSLELYIYIYKAQPLNGDKPWSVVCCNSPFTTPGKSTNPPWWITVRRFCKWRFAKISHYPTSLRWTISYRDDNLVELFQIDRFANKYAAEEAEAGLSAVQSVKEKRVRAPKVPSKSVLF